MDTRLDAGAPKGDWVTIGGTHVLLGEGGVAMSGGKLKGMTFANAKSQKRTTGGGGSGGGGKGGSSGGSGGSGGSEGGAPEKAGRKITPEQQAWLDKKKAVLSAKSPEANKKLFDSWGGEWAEKAKKAYESGTMDDLIDEYVNQWGKSFENGYDIPGKQKQSMSQKQEQSKQPAKAEKLAASASLANPAQVSGTQAGPSTLSQTASQSTPSSTPKKYTSYAEEKAAFEKMSYAEKVNLLTDEGYIRRKIKEDYINYPESRQEFVKKFSETYLKTRQEDYLAMVEAGNRPTARGHLKTLPTSADNRPSRRGTLQVIKDTGMDRDEAKKMFNGVYNYSGSNYAGIRASQRAGQPNKDAIAIEEYISLAPTWKGGTLYRGIAASSQTAERILSAAQTGQPIDMGGVSSWSSTKSVAEGFITRNKGAGKTNILFRTSGTKQGTSIRHLSQNDLEEEVAISQNARWIPTKVTKQGSKYIIDCTEVE